jgi:hypothetical protein
VTDIIPFTKKFKRFIIERPGIKPITKDLGNQKKLCLM